jgi:hypothetical protein
MTMTWPGNVERCWYPPRRKGTGCVTRSKELPSSIPLTRVDDERARPKSWPIIQRRGAGDGCVRDSRGWESHVCEVLRCDVSVCLSGSPSDGALLLGGDVDSKN